MLKIRVKDIAADGLDFEGQITAQELKLTDKDDPKFLEPVKVAAHIEKVGMTLIVNAAFEANYLTECARCAEPASAIVEGELDYDFPYDKSVEDIEIGEEIREELILNAPVRILCKEDCQGVCKGCGANLNEEECKCKIELKNPKH